MIKVHHRGLVEFFAGFSISLYGLWWLNPWLDSFSMFPTYTQLGRIAPEAVWGLGFLVAGVTLLLGAFLHHRWLLLAGAALCMMSRLFLLVLIGFQNNWTSNGVADFGVWALMAIYSMVRAFRNET